MKARARAAAALVLLGLFLLGMAAGGGLVRWLHVRSALARLDEPPDLAPRRQLEALLRTRLELDETQTAQLRALLERNSAQHRLLRREIEPRASQLRQALARDVRALLREDQLPRFEALHAASEARLERWLLQGPPDGGSGDQP